MTHSNPGPLAHSVIRGSKVGLAVSLGMAVLTSGGMTMSATGAEVPFTSVVVDDSPPARPYYKMIGDIDGDGYADIVVGGARGPLVWYRYPDWGKAEIASGGYRGVRGDIDDVDGDGDADIVMGGVVWFANPGIGGGQWQMIRIDNLTAHDVELGDVDRDGRLDVVARDQSAFGGSGNTVYVYRQQSPTAWQKQVIRCPHGEGVKLVDLDGDKDLDIVIGGIWYENIGDLTQWPEHRYTAAWQEPDAKVEVADFNQDGRQDIVLTPAELRGETYKAAWYEAPEDRKQAGWVEHVIVPSIEAVIHSLAVGDFDGDGDDDVAMAEMHQGQDPDEVTVHLNLGGGATWHKQVISTDGSHDIIAADMGRDGDLDILGANHAGDSHPVELWRNDLDPSK
jgi:hypothetical protein